MRNIHYSRQLNDKRFVGSLEFVSRENSTFCNILAFAEGGVSYYSSTSPGGTSDCTQLN